MTASALKWLILALSALGIADSWYLAESALTDTPLACGIEHLDGCNIVAQSAYSHLLGVPLGVYGVVFYSGLILITLIAISRPRVWASTLLLLGGTLGIIASIVFVGIQVFLINAICVYCLGSAVLCLLVFAAALMLWRKSGGEASPSIPATAVVS